MSLFTIRVELHHANPVDYTTLANSLRSAGITDVITADNGSRWKLPPGEYCVGSHLSRNALADQVKNIASCTGRRHAVVVTEGAVTWHGLARA